MVLSSRRVWCESAVGFGADQRDKILKGPVTPGSRARADSQAAHPVFEAGTLRIVEAAGTAVVGIPKHGSGHHVLGIASSGEEATVIATMLRLFNPN